MIRIQGDDWKPECIAAIGQDTRDTLLRILPVGGATFIIYEYLYPSELAREYKRIRRKWVTASRKGGAA